MTKRERAMIRSCISNGLEFCHDMRRGFVGKETIDLDRFNAIVEEVEVALDKQEPSIPFYTINQYGLKVWRCGSCESGIDQTMKYCYQCGHKIKWEEDDDEQY